MTPEQRNRALIIGGIVAAAVAGGVSVAAILWPEDETKCVYATTLEQFPDGGSDYFYVRACSSGPSLDGGELDVLNPALPSGMTSISYGPFEDYDGGAAFVSIAQGERSDSIRWPCACATAEGACEEFAWQGMSGQVWQPATITGATIGVEYRDIVDGGCFGKACVELAGHTSWPAQCPVPPPPEE